MGLRERQKSRRRDHILEAARELLRSTGSTDFPMRELADTAAVSVVTPYNLFGSKSGILYALLNDTLERLGGTDETRGTARADEDVLTFAGNAANVYADDARFFRPLLRHLLGVPDDIHRPVLLARSLERWTRNVTAAQDAGIVDSAADVDHLSRQLMITFLGAVELWVHEELDNAGFEAHALYGSAILVAVYATDDARPDINRRLRELEQRLPRGLDLPGPAATTRFSAA